MDKISQINRRWEYITKNGLLAVAKGYEIPYIYLCIWVKLATRKLSDHFNRESFIWFIFSFHSLKWCGNCLYRSRTMADFWNFSNQCSVCSNNPEVWEYLVEFTEFQTLLMYCPLLLFPLDISTVVALYLYRPFSSKASMVSYYILICSLLQGSGIDSVQYFIVTPTGLLLCVQSEYQFDVLKFKP